MNWTRYGIEGFAKYCGNCCRAPRVAKDLPGRLFIQETAIHIHKDPILLSLRLVTFGSLLGSFREGKETKHGGVHRYRLFAVGS